MPKLILSVIAEFVAFVVALASLLSLIFYYALSLKAEISISEAFVKYQYNPIGIAVVIAVVMLVAFNAEKEHPPHH